jgi:copper(I)-binding protein
VKRFLIALAATLLWSSAAPAHEYEIGKILIAHPWSRPTAPGISMGVAYFSLQNRGSTEDVLLSASTPVALRVEIHQTTINEGMARMRPLAQVTLPPGKTVKVEPGGIHLMLVGLKQALESGKQVQLTLQFRDAGSITVMLNIEHRDQVGLEN